MSRHKHTVPLVVACLVAAVGANPSPAAAKPKEWCQYQLSPAKPAVSCINPNHGGPYTS